MKDYSPPPASTGIWVVLASIGMTFAAFSSALIVRQGDGKDWHHLTLPSILYLEYAGAAGQQFCAGLARRQVGAFMVGPKTAVRIRPARSLKLRLRRVGSTFPWVSDCFLSLASMWPGCSCGLRACFSPRIPTVLFSMC